eukprot:11706893-Karenia_brevis.AAC.1
MEKDDIVEEAEAKVLRLHEQATMIERKRLLSEKRFWLDYLRHQGTMEQMNYAQVARHHLSVENGLPE